MHSFSFPFTYFFYFSSLKKYSNISIFISLSEPLGLSYLLGIVGGVLAAFLILFLLCIHVVRTKKCCFKGIFCVLETFSYMFVMYKHFYNKNTEEEPMLIFDFHLGFIFKFLFDIYFIYLFFINFFSFFS